MSREWGVKVYKQETDMIFVVFLVKNFNSFLSSLHSIAIT